MRRGLIGLIGLMGLMAPCGAVTFSNWVAGYSLVDATPAGDDDQDGWPNALEYALAGMSPEVSDSHAQVAMVFGTRQTNTVPPWHDPAVIEYYGTKPPVSGYWYLGLRWTPRPDIEGVRIRPQYFFPSSNLEMCVDGRAVWLPPVAHGTNGAVISWMLQMFRHTAPPRAAFARLRVILDE